MNIINDLNQSPHRLINDLYDLKEILTEGIENEDLECVENAIAFIDDIIADYSGNYDHTVENLNNDDDN